MGIIPEATRGGAGGLLKKIKYAIKYSIIYVTRDVDTIQPKFAYLHIHKGLYDFTNLATFLYKGLTF